MAGDDEHLEWLAVIAHELRKPLSAVVFAVDALEERVGADPELAAARARIERNVDRMVSVVDRLVELAHLRSGEIVLRVAPVEPADLMRRASAAAQPLMHAQGHRFEVGPAQQLAPIEGDEHWLTRALEHLLRNAALYTAPAGHVRLEASEDEAQTVLRVVDDGPGLAPQQLRELTRPFARAGDRSVRGLGAGLPIARSVAELHGGRLELRSDGPGRGTEARLCLPRSAARPYAAEGESLRVHLLRGPGAEGRVVETLLRSWGWDVQVVDDPAGLATASPVVVVDLAFPGLEPSALVAQRAAGSGWVLVGQPARDGADALDGDAVPVVPKPVDPDVLRAAVRRAAASGRVPGRE